MIPGFFSDIPNHFLSQKIDFQINEIFVSFFMFLETLNEIFLEKFQNKQKLYCKKVI